MGRVSYILNTVVLLALGFTLSRCTSLTPTHSPAAEQSTPGINRGLAATPMTVRVDLPDHRPLTLPSPEFQFPNTRLLTDHEIETLKSYIQKHREQLGARGEIGFSLSLSNQRQVGKRLYVRFSQQLTRRIGLKDYFIPVEGADVIAFIDSHGLTRLNSHLLTPPSLGPSLQNPGFQFQLSESEFAALMTHIKLSEGPRESIKKYFAATAARAKLVFEFDTFLNSQISEQRETLNYFFGSLSSAATARILIDLARERQLALIRHGTKWMFQVTGFFLLPIEFDIEIPASDGEKLTVKNLRELRTSASSINGYQSPNFPGGEKTQGGESVLRASQNLQIVMDFFNANFDWPSYRGKGIEQDIEVHTKLRSIDYRENAAWLIKQEKFIIGEGGETLANLENSLSVLGHEYTHAVVQFSSGLEYRSDAGAINEHFADFMGAIIDSVAHHDGKFTYHVGADILTPPVLVEKRNLSDLIIAKYKYSPEEVSSFALKEPSLRQLYAPKLSFAAQFDDFAKLRKAYPENCQPSYNNDNCGIHLASGVLNRAASLIIAEFGIKETQQILLNTIAYRLTATARFNDYLIQFYDECRETPSLAERCGVILKSFAAVGIVHPQFQEQDVDQDVPIKQTVDQASDTASGMTQGERDLHTETNGKQTFAASPVLKFCGWVDSVDDDLIRIVDGKFNATILKKNHALQSIGEYRELLNWQCACATGHITHVTGGDGRMVNAFLDIHAVQDRKNFCAGSPRLRKLRPAPRARATPKSESEGTYCGWLSINSQTKNITLIDGKRDPVVISTSTPSFSQATRGTFAGLFKEQCACVTGKTASTGSGGGSQNWFTEIAPDGVNARPSEACAGIKWK